jgi:hypothetical protein
MKNCMFVNARIFLLCLFMACVILIFQNETSGQEGGRRRGRRGIPNTPPTLGLEQGVDDIDTPDFNLQLVRASQTVAALEPKTAIGFDFTPYDQLEARSRDGFYHLGDLNLRIRIGESGQWLSISTAAARKPVKALETSSQILAAADLSHTLPEDCPLQITRTWALDNGKLILRFDLRNKTEQPVQIGALGIPLIFNNYITRRSLEEAHVTCSFSDPTIGLDGGYVQVTRLNGHGPALMVVAFGKTPFEAYNPLLDDRTQRSQTFEGFYEWMVHSQAYAENEWKDAKPWNPPTTATIAPGRSVTYGLKFLVAPEIRKIEETLIANQRPVAVGIPGYILPQDLNARLFLNYPQKVTSIKVEPEGAINVTEQSAAPNGWKSYMLQGKSWGRVRLIVTFADGLTQSIQYYITKPAGEVLADMGHFMTTRQWYDDPNDPFGRSPSVMNYNRQRNEIILQDSRVWIAGLGDEGGTGGWIAAIMKQHGEPEKTELEKLQKFIDQVLWGRLQYSDGERKYGVRKSLFYYDPNLMPDFIYDPNLNWGSWTSWNKRGADAVDRSFNYPHIAAAHWVMYRLARNNSGLVTNHPWDWYLDNAYRTCTAMMQFARGYARHGQMEGDIFVEILRDLKREGWEEKASELESVMKKRTERWRGEEYPFGSEMAWDSTGQEEVYAWCKYFGYDDKALITLNAVLGYMPTVPHWGYNGNARRYWDFIYGAAPGPTSRIERQIHHYGSSINAIPVLHAYRERPDDFYLLRVGYGGMMGTLTNIDREGFASAAFHAWPSTLKWDTITGDFGPNFFGHAWNTATYLVNHPEFGWQAFGGNLAVEGDIIKVKPLDSFRMRFYIAPYGLWLTLDSGAFEDIEINTEDRVIRIGFSAATQYTPTALLRIEQPAKITGGNAFKPSGNFQAERGAFVVPLESKTTRIELIQTN